MISIFQDSKIFSRICRVNEESNEESYHVRNKAEQLLHQVLYNQDYTIIRVLYLIHLIGHNWVDYHCASKIIVVISDYVAHLFLYLTNCLLRSYLFL